MAAPFSASVQLINVFILSLRTYEQHIEIITDQHKLKENNSQFY